MLAEEFNCRRREADAAVRSDQHLVSVPSLRLAPDCRISSTEVKISDVIRWADRQGPHGVAMPRRAKPTTDGSPAGFRSFSASEIPSKEAQFDHHRRFDADVLSSAPSDSNRWLAVVRRSAGRSFATDSCFRLRRKRAHSVGLTLPPASGGDANYGTSLRASTSLIRRSPLRLHESNRSR
jgi:hypothetical protein